MTELSGSGHDSSYYDDRSDHERERHKEKKKKKKKKSEKEKYLDDEERRKRKVKEGGGGVQDERERLTGLREGDDLLEAEQTTKGSCLPCGSWSIASPLTLWGGSLQGWEPGVRGVAGKRVFLSQLCVPP